MVLAQAVSTKNSLIIDNDFSQKAVTYQTL